MAGSAAKSGAETSGRAGPQAPTKHAAPRDEDDEYEYTMRMDHGWTLSDGTFEGYPLHKRRKRDVPNPRGPFVEEAHRSMNSLTSIQLASNAPITMTTMDLCSQHVWKAWPPEIRAQVWVPPPNGPGLWGECAKTAEDIYERMDKMAHRFSADPADGETRYSFYVTMKKWPWVVWPVYVEDEHGYDWVTVVWHAQNSNPDLEKKKKVFDRLVAYAIIDPRRDLTPGPDGKHHPVNKRLDRIRERLYDLWERAGMDATGARDLKLLSSPIPKLEHCSGERCYSAIKELGNQIIKWHLNGKTFCPKTTLTNLSPWVNPYNERIELGGVAAWSLMASFDYNARLTVEAIPPSQRVDVNANGMPRKLYAWDLAGPPYDLFIASPDYLLPGDNKKQKQGKSKGKTVAVSSPFKPVYREGRFDYDVVSKYTKTA